MTGSTQRDGSGKVLLANAPRNDYRLAIPRLSAISTACVRSVTCNLLKMLLTWKLTVLEVIHKAAPISWLLLLLAIKRSTCSSRSLSSGALIRSTSLAPTPEGMNDCPWYAVRMHSKCFHSIPNDSRNDSQATYTQNCGCRRWIFAVCNPKWRCNDRDLTGALVRNLTLIVKQLTTESEGSIGCEPDSCISTLF